MIPTTESKQSERDHPTLQQLRAYANGMVDSDQTTWIEDHVSACHACAQDLENAPEDALVALLRGHQQSENGNCELNEVSAELQVDTGRTAARFELLKQLGHGGMGVVYLAWQPALRRHIALKMIARGDLANREDFRRFRREAEAAASLRHENIAQIYDVGEQDGKPYIAMELVRGCTLSQYLKHGPLSVDVAVSLFIKLADAVQHAHSHSVIHRDLKPSNILLAGSELPSNDPLIRIESRIDFQPKIVDFGLAKRVDQVDSPTLTGDLIGTPSYMSPEQAQGNVQATGVGSDIYSLGAVFYEVLVGRPPFQGASPIETLELVLSQEPVRPTNLRAGLPRDIETICLKCLEKSPSRRYARASDLLDDLRRFQSGRPIAARPTGWVTRTMKWTKRKPALAALFASIAVGTASMLTIAALHNRSMSRALEANREEKSRADTNFKFAIRSIEQMLERVGFDQLSNQPEMEEMRAELLTDAVNFYAELLATQPETDIESRRMYYRALSRQGNILWMLGKNDSGRKSLQLAIDLQTQLSKELPKEPSVQHELAKSYISHGLIDRNSASFRTAIDLLEDIQATYPTCQLDLAQALTNLATTTALSDEAEAHHLRSLGLRQKLLQQMPNDQRLKFGVGQSQYNLGFLYFRTGRLDIASEALSEAISIFEELVEQHGTVTDYQSSLAECYTSFATLRNQTGEFDIADTLMQKGINIRSLLVTRFPKIPSMRMSLARSYLTQVSFLHPKNHYAEAFKLGQKALEIAEQLNREVPHRDHQLFVAASLTILATSASGVPDILAAKVAFEKATGIYDMLLSETPNDVHCQAEAGVNSMNYSNIIRPEDPIRALEYNDRSVVLLEKLCEQDPKRQDFRSYLFNAQGARAQTLEALMQYREAATAWAKTMEVSPAEHRLDLQILQAIAMARGGDHHAAYLLGRQLVKNDELGGANLYNVACLFGILDQQDKRESSKDPDGSLLDTSNSDMAIEVLSRPASMAFLREASGRQQLISDPDLATVPLHPCFQELWDSLK